MRNAGDLVEIDDHAHAREHSLEVQVPFLQFIYRARLPKLLPICIRTQPFSSLEKANQAAKVLGETLKTLLGDRRAVVIASTDFSHQVPQQVAERQDGLAREQIEQMQPAGLLQTVVAHDISMCGSIPVAVALWYALARGARSGELLCYYTSGDIVGEQAAVVGYASLKIESGD